MLIITRKKGEALVIQDNIEVTILDIQGDRIRVGIEAPNEIKIMRRELLETELLNKEATKIPGEFDIENFKKILKNISFGGDL